MVDMVIGSGVGVADPNFPSNWVVSSWSNAEEITPSDSTVYSPSLKQLWVGTGGNVAVRMAGNGATVTILAVPNGGRIPVNVDMVMETNTTASDILGLW